MRHPYRDDFVAMFSAFVTLALVATNVYGTQHLDRNLAYRSPFSNDPQASVPI